jgi:hypothetical protein
MRIRMDPGKVRLECERDRICRSHPSLAEIREIKRKIEEYEQEFQRHVDHITKVWGSMRKNWQDELTLCLECTSWVRSAPSNLQKIKLQSTQEMKRLEWLQEVERNELFPPTDDTEAQAEDQAICPDLNQVIASALASHAVQASPADCPFLRGYGDDQNIESTRWEKSGSKDWNLLGLRGTEAIQVSSHRGPHTDRSPDKPPTDRPPTDRGFAGEGEHPSHPLPTGILRTQFSLLERQCVFPCSQCNFGEVTPSSNLLRSCSWHLSRSQSGAELDVSEVWSVQGQQDTCACFIPPFLKPGS